jgi:hypothetical protein
MNRSLWRQASFRRAHLDFIIAAASPLAYRCYCIDCKPGLFKRTKGPINNIVLPLNVPATDLSSCLRAASAISL